MTQIIEHACPNITCGAFNDPWPLECTDDLPYGEGYYEPECDDDSDCGACGTHVVSVEMLERYLKRLKKQA